MTRQVVVLGMVFLAGAGLAGQGTREVPSPVADSWPTYHGDYSGQHFSKLNQITTQNVHGLTLGWIYRLNTATDGAVVGGPAGAPAPAQGRAGGGAGPAGAAPGAGGPPAAFGGGAARAPDIKAIPLVVDGVLYVSTPTNAWAIDARTGDEIWHYIWRGRSVIGNRGIGKYGDWLFMETGENSLLSLDAKTGKERWVKPLAEGTSANFSTSAPVIVKNHVIVGVGGDSGSGYGWAESRDPETGNLQWKWNVTPRAGEPGITTWPSEAVALKGSGGVWQPPTYDPELNLLYVTTGQPTPTFNGISRPGSNLYTCSVVALNADTGTLVWYYQMSPHDTHDWDSTQVPILLDGVVGGQPRKLLAQANRNGYFFLLDRVTGKSLVVTKFLPTANGYLGVDQGLLVRDPGKDPSPAGTLVFPDSDGAANYPAASFDPETGLFYVNSTNASSLFYLSHDSTDPTGFGRGSEYHTGLFESTLLALDYRTGRAVWQHKYPQQVGFFSSTYPGALTTAGGLLFTGDPSGNFVAYDARAGKILWHAQLGKGVISNTPITFTVDGRQVVVVASRDTLFGFYLQ